MGRIKSTMIKKAAKQLLSENKEVFSTNQDHNKRALNDTMPSKSVRNKVAGYITRLARAEQTAKIPKVKKEEVKEEVPQYMRY